MLLFIHRGPKKSMTSSNGVEKSQEKVFAENLSFMEEV